MRAAPLSLLLLLPLAAEPAELLNVSVDRVDDRYVMESEVWFDADIEQMYAVLLDWDQSTKFSSVVVESRNLEPDEQGRRQFYNRNEACVAFFCQSFERYGVVEHRPFEYIKASAYPDRSDFHRSEEHWQFREEDGGTVVVYSLVFEPKFFVPPLIGPYMIKRKLRNGSGNAINRIEAVARSIDVDRDELTSIATP